VISSGVRLSEDHAAEIQRRSAEKEPASLSLADFNERLRARYGV